MRTSVKKKKKIEVRKNAYIRQTANLGVSKCLQENLIKTKIFIHFLYGCASNLLMSWKSQNITIRQLNLLAKQILESLDELLLIEWTTTVQI